MPRMPQPLTMLALLLLCALVAGAAYLVGRQHARTALRQAREALRRAEGWQTGWPWQTDATGRLLHWQGPPAADPHPSPCPLFPQQQAPAALAARLRLQQPFDGLRLRLPQAWAGSRGWVLQGAPHYDDSGALAGHSGLARPTDDDDRRDAAALALPPALAAHGGAALMALDDGSGWRVARLNDEAARWSGLREGDPLRRLDKLPPLLAQALADGQAHDHPPQDQPPGAVPPGVLEADGWRLQALPMPEGAARAWLLTQAPRPTAAPGDDGEGETFGFTVSHDLRAPVRVVEGFTRIVKEDYGHLLDRVGNDHLDRVLGAAARMNLMIDALMTLARLSSQPLAHQPVNLSQLAGYVCDDLRRGTPERSVELEIEPGLSVSGDPTLLRLVLENLLGNAWKYTARTARPHISLRRLDDGGRRVFVVRDNGAGFDMRSSDRLFGLFQRLHSASEFAGHGVGLASVRRIVRRHGGEIWAEAEPGRGAAFHFTIGAGR